MTPIFDAAPLLLPLLIHINFGWSDAKRRKNKKKSFRLDHDHEYNHNM